MGKWQNSGHGLALKQDIGYSCQGTILSPRNPDELPLLPITCNHPVGRQTSLGYHTFRCSECQRKFNKRTGTVYNNLQFPTDVVMLVVMWRLRYKLSRRDLAEMFLVRGFEFTHEAVRDREAHIAPLITEQLRTWRRGKAGRSWHVDATYVKVGGKWCIYTEP